jgi:signal transduction histidine kinase
LLSDLRTAVSELREDEPVNFIDAMHKLINGLPGITVDLNLSSVPGDTQIADTLLRCTREALTNVLRHSAATRCHIDFRADDMCYHLRINDNGTHSGPITPGNGLKGIKERIEEAGGCVDWSNEQGFILHIRLPINRLLTEKCPPVTTSPA